MAIFHFCNLCQSHIDQPPPHLQSSSTRSAKIQKRKPKKETEKKEKIRREGGRLTVEVFADLQVYMLTAGVPPGEADTSKLSVSASVTTTAKMRLLLFGNGVGKKAH